LRCAVKNYGRAGRKGLELYLRPKPMLEVHIRIQKVNRPQGEGKVNTFLKFCFKVNIFLQDDVFK